MKNRSFVVVLIIIALALLPVTVSSEGAANTTAVVTTPLPSTESLVNTTTLPVTAVVSTVAETRNTTAIPTTNVTSVPQTTTVLPQNISVATTALAGSIVTQASTGNLTTASSPLGASVLIDGVYHGVTPGTISGIAAGNHIVRLTLSGYYDYEGTIYVVPGQVTSVYGTLPPLRGQVVSTSTLTSSTTAPVATPVPTTTSSSGVFENPTVIAAIIGIITASIGAAATVFTHVAKMKKE
ncbi:PEGA domain-containing protein [Methanoregula sp.]|uniref:PEGA domain-containing protein n=1 Tax=Methanoregula sp. TaxID=2052170 RepID=UPI00356A86C6